MDTRVCVKGLSKNATEQDLKKAFSRKGEVTDVRIIRTSTGRSRLFGFVGYRCPQQANDCVCYFNNTYMDSSKISVEMAKKVGSTELQIPRSVRSRGKKEKKKGFIGSEKNTEIRSPFKSPEIARDGGKIDAASELLIDKRKKDFLESINSSMKVMDGSLDLNDKSLQFISCVSEIGEGESSCDNTSRKDRDNDDEDIIVESIDIDDNTNMNQRLKDTADDKKSIYVRNLSYGCSEAELSEYFSSCGEIKRVHIPLDDTKRNKGFGFICFSSSKFAENAKRYLDGSSFLGRTIHIMKTNESKSMYNFQEETMKSKFSTYQCREKDDEKLNSFEENIWNVSHINSNAVVDTVAHRFGVLQSNVMDTTKAGGDIAVRLAIGEGKVTQENFEFFSRVGVDLAAIEGGHSSRKSIDRSGTTLLIKNLPFDSVTSELENMFRRYGDISQFLMPPSKTIAIVEYVEPSEARLAFTGLAYRRYKHVPLYVEWAPLNLLSRDTTVHLQSKSSESLKLDSLSPLNSSNCSDKSIFIRNLDYGTTEDGIRHHLLQVGYTPQSIRAISVPKSNDKEFRSSMGYGFVEIRSCASVEEVVNSLSGTKLDGRSLDVVVSKKRQNTNSSASFNSIDHLPATSPTAKTSFKLIVKNLAFQATTNEVNDLFSPFGRITNIRMPKKRTGLHRGFAFIDFSTREEASNAMNALKRSHLYGRHLVIDWAEEEADDVPDLIRKKQKTFGVS